MFWRNGFAATSLDDLAAATGMNRPSLYAAFGDKRGLYLKTLERYRDQTRATARELLADEPTLRTFLERFYEAALAVYCGEPERARGCYSIGTAATEAEGDEAVRAFLAESIDNTDAFLGGLIAKASDAGEISADSDPASLAQIATATLHTLAVRSRAGYPIEGLRKIAAATIDLICKQ